MRILQVIPTYLPAWRHGGPALAVHALSRALVAAGHRVTVFTSTVHGTGELDVAPGLPVERDGVEVVYFRVSRPRRLSRSPAMRRALRERIDDFDVLHLHSVFLAFTSTAARVAERVRTPYVLAPRGMLVPDLLRSRGRLRKAVWLRTVERRTLERAAAIQVTTELEANDLARLGLHLPPVVVVPNGVDASQLRADAAEPPSASIAAAISEGPFFLFLGRVSWKKGLDRLLPWIAAVPHARLVIAGNDEEGLSPRLARLASQHGAVERIVFVGGVRGADRAALLDAAIALVLPSLSENFGNVVLEAMALGTPVLVTPEVGLASMVEEEAVGMVVPARSESWIEALNRLEREPELRASMGRRGIDVAARRFGWATVARSMVALYDQTTSARAREDHA